MKFKIQRSRQVPVRAHLRPKIKGHNTLRLIKRGLPARDPLADSFGRFDNDNVRTSVWQRIAVFIRNKIAVSKGKEPLLSLSYLCGALCAALAVCLLVGATVLYALFFSHGISRKSVVIPSFVSLDTDTALSAYTDIFEYNVVYERNPDYPAGAVISQSPKGGVTRRLYGLRDKISITLTVNSTPTPFVLPDLLGTSLRDSLLLMRNNGIRVRVVEEYSDRVPFGNVISVSLPEGSALYNGDTVTLHSSLGKEPVYSTVPALVGLSESEAIKLLRAEGITVDRIEYEASELPQGTVLQQSIDKGVSLKQGERISLTVSGGKYFSP